MSFLDRTGRAVFLCLALALAGGASAAPTGGGAGEPRFTDDFETGLGGWELYGEGGAFILDSRDAKHGNVLVLRPQGDVYALVKGSSRWGGLAIEGDVLFPEDIDSYFGVVYNFTRRGPRTDFGLIYIKGNDGYLSVNPHRDFNVGRTLYEEYRTPLTGTAAVRIGAWQRFKAEVVGSTCHFYVGDMTVPQLTFSSLELSSGAIGLQPRSVGGDVWVDNVAVTPIAAFSYTGAPRPAVTHEEEQLLTRWEVIGPLAETDDEVARQPTRQAWRPFATDDRGAVVTGRIVDYHGPKTVAYFRSRIPAEAAQPSYLHVSTVDDLAVWLNGRFQWFIPRGTAAWHDFWRNPAHKGQRIPIALAPGTNELVVRVRGGVYASGGFFARIER